MIISSRVQSAQALREALRVHLLQSSEDAAWRDFFEASTGQLLLDLLTGISELLMFKVATRSREAYLPTAITRSSVYLLAQMVGYNPNRKRHAYGMLRGRFRGAGAKQDTILKQGTVLNTSSTPLIVKEDITLIKGTKDFSGIPVIQGEWKEVFFSNDLEYAQQLYRTTETPFSFIASDWAALTVPGENFTIDQFQYQLFVNGTQIDTIDKVEVRELPDSAIEKIQEVDGQSFVRNYPSIILSEHILTRTGAETAQVLTDFTGGVTLVFGDGTFGHKLLTTDHVKFRYLDTLGLSGSLALGVSCGNHVFSTGDIVDFWTQSRITGGANEDSVEKVRAMGLKFFSTQGRMVTRFDHDIYTQTYPGVIDARSWRLENGCCQIAICPVKEDFSTWTVTEQKALFTYLENYKMVSSELVFIAPEAVPLNLTIRVTTKTLIGYSSLVEAAEELLQATLGKLENAFSSLDFVDRFKDLFEGIQQVFLLDVNGADNYPELTLTKSQFFVLGVLDIQEVTA